MKAKSLLVLVFIGLLIVNTIHSDRFPNESKKYSIAIKGKERIFYPYKAFDYLSVALKEVSQLGEDEVKFYNRNPHVCFKVKITMVFSEFVSVYGSSRKVFFRDELKEKSKNIAKGDNIWVFAKIKTFENNDIDIIAQHFFDLPSDEEVFLKWRKAVPSEDENGLINLGFKAIQTGVEKGNLDVWKKLGLQTIEQGLKIKQQKLTNPGEYVTIAKKVMKLLNDKDFALKVVLMGWEKNKENSDLKQYLRHVLQYAQYKNKWMPEAQRYEKEFRDKFNAIKFTEDDKMWELKRWVEINADKFRDPQEKIILCARRTYEMNPARRDAAAFIGREPSEIKGFTSSGEITVPRIPVVIKTEGGMLEFTVDNLWAREADVVDPVKVKYRSDAKGATSVMVTDIEWGANLVELNKKYIAKVKELGEFKLLENDTVTIKGKSYYWAKYTYFEGGVKVRADAVLIKTKGDLPGLGVIFRTADASYGKYTKEFTNIRESLLYKE